MSSVSAPNNICANCGKGEEESGNLKSCTACYMVKYCNRDCQIAHRPQHKKECKKRAAELYDEKLFKEVEPEECPICMLPLPNNEVNSIVNSCCGKTICKGCVYAMIVGEGKNICPFCRMPIASTTEEYIERAKELVKKGSAEAFDMLAGLYHRGQMGSSPDYQKAVEFSLKAGELGCAQAYNNLGMYYSKGDGVEVDTKKASHYFELAAMGGFVNARHNLGWEEWQKGNKHRAMKHFFIAAKAGSNDSLGVVKYGFEKGLVTKDEYESTLRAFNERHKEMKSDMRDKAETSNIKGLRL